VHEPAEYFIQIWHVGRISHTSLQPMMAHRSRLGDPRQGKTSLAAPSPTFPSARWRWKKFPDHREFQARHANALAAGFDASKSTAPTAICWINLQDAQQAHRRLRRIDREPGEADARSVQVVAAKRPSEPASGFRR